MDSVFTEVSRTLDWSVKMEKTLRTQARNNGLAMLVKRQFSAYLDAQEELQKAIDGR